MLQNKKILLGVCGGIAAYKTAFLVRLLIKQGAEVKVIMTPASFDFVTPLTLSTLSKNPVLFDFIDKETGSLSWNNHVDLAHWADIMIIAPATAHTISKMSMGNCDNLLLAAYLSARCPVYIAPAMDLEMYQHGSTKSSLNKLCSYGNEIIPAAVGELASGLSGEGRMAEPEEIIRFITASLLQKAPLHGKKVLITAGPTHEPLDPVRFLGNRATGTMGYELAKAALDLGARVSLVSGPTHLKLTSPYLEVLEVETAIEMHQAVMKHFEHMDVVIAAAAVADYRPEKVSPRKIKKTNTQNFTLKFVPNPDILLEMGQKKSGQFLVGFALETDNELKNAKDKIKRKNLDAIILNSLRDIGAGFGPGTNKITFIDKNFEEKSFDVKTKDLVAKDIWQQILSIIDA